MILNGDCNEDDRVLRLNKILSFFLHIHKPISLPDYLQGESFSILSQAITYNLTHLRLHTEVQILAGLDQNPQEVWHHVQSPHDYSQHESPSDEKVSMGGERSVHLYTLGQIYNNFALN
jgi:hypothetical protein